MKFTTKPTQPNGVPFQATAENLYLAQLSVQDAYQKYVETSAACEELATIVDNIEQVTDAVRQHGPKALEVLGTMTKGSLEAFIGAEAMCQTKLAEASLENKFTDAVKNVWAKIKEWFARLFDWIRMTFASLDGELKHLGRMVEPANDSKFNPDASFENPIPTKDALLAVLSAVSIVGTELEKVGPDLIKFFEEMNTIDFSKISLSDDNGESDRSEEAKAEAIFEKWSDVADSLNDRVTDAFKANPILTQYIDNTADALNSAADISPFELLKAVDARLIRSGTASELGYKSASDLRAVINKFIELEHLGMRNGPLIGKATKLSTSLFDKIANETVSQKVLPASAAKTVRLFMKLIGMLYSKQTKLNRFVLMYITRAVRHMYK